MVRKVSPESSGVSTGRPRAVPVSPARLGPLPQTQPQPRRTAPGGDWMSEILFEAQFGARTDGAEPGPETGPAAEAPRFNRHELQGAAGAVGTLPRSVAEYRRILHGLFDERSRQAADSMLEEPVLRSMRDVWQPGKPQTNHKVALEFMRYFMPKLGEAYRFKPCPVEFDDTLSGGYNGLYDIRFDRVYLPRRILAGSFSDFVEVLVHEQIHCFQERMMARLNVAQNGVPLTPQERAIATYWKNEQPKYRSAMANGSQMSDETRRRYREIGQEYHAITTGRQIRSVLIPQ